MSNTKHTRGTWEVRHSDKHDAFNVIGTSPGEKYKIARCPYLLTSSLPEYNEREKAEAEANAKLIASAPDLLASCKDFVLFWERSGYNEDSAMYQDAKAAIKKATP